MQRRRPSKIWLEVVKNDIKSVGLASADALDCRLGGGRLWGIHADPGLPGALLQVGVFLCVWSSIKRKITKRN